MYGLELLYKIYFLSKETVLCSILCHFGILLSFMFLLIYWFWALCRVNSLIAVSILGRVLYCEQNFTQTTKKKDQFISVYECRCSLWCCT